MELPGQTFKPLPPGFRSVPRPQYNALLKVGQRASSLGGNGLSIPELQAVIADLVDRLRIVEVDDSSTGDGYTLYEDISSAVPVYAKGSSHPIQLSTFDWNGPVYPKGERVVCLYDRSTGRHLPVCPPALVRFVLAEQLIAGNESADANLLEWTTTGGGSYGVNTDVTFRVYDAIGAQFEGNVGSRGYARWFGDRGVYEIIQLACP